MGAAQGDSAGRGGIKGEPSCPQRAVKSVGKDLNGKEPKKRISSPLRAGDEGSVDLPSARRFGDRLRLSEEPDLRAGTPNPKKRTAPRGVAQQQRQVPEVAPHAPVSDLSGAKGEAVEPRTGSAG